MATWRNIIGILSALPLLMAVGEFFGGKELNRWIKSKLEDWWLRLDEISVPNVGVQEATFALRLMQKVFGSSAFSWRRIWASAIFVLLFTVCTFPLFLPSIFEIPKDGTPLHFDISLGLIAYEFGSFFLHAVFTAWLSISTSYAVIRFSISKYPATKFATLYFFLMIIVSASISAVLLPFLDIVSVSLVSYLSVQLISPTGALGDLTGASPGFRESYEIAASKDNPLVQWHFALGIVLLLLRSSVAIIFLMWMATGWALFIVKRAIYQLFDTDKGALTIVSAVVAAATGFLIKWASSP